MKRSLLVSCSRFIDLGTGDVKRLSLEQSREAALMVYRVSVRIEYVLADLEEQIIKSTDQIYGTISVSEIKDPP